MLKKYVTTLNIVLVCALILAFIPREYRVYFLCFAALIVIPIGIFNLIKLRREDKLSGTNTLWTPIYSMGIVAVVLIVFFFLTKQNHI